MPNYLIDHATIMKSVHLQSIYQSRTSCALVVGLLIPAISAMAQPPVPSTNLVEEQSSKDDQSSPSANENQESGVEFLTRGPLHEAFATPYEANPEPQPSISRKPPAAIEEIPPEYKPEGNDVAWIPGYWMWDEERDDFVWLSGIWRALPPGRRWVPGYWDQVTDGYRYVNGFWAGQELVDVEYLPLPPTSLEQGPSSPSPGDGYFYAPGNWVYNDNNYKWQPGNWSQSQENWVWMPSQYGWTPRGAVYQDGYWDYNVSHRGVSFAPVYYQQPIYQNPGYTYRPHFTLSTGIGMFVHLFINPRSGQYYYGDYYGQQYSNRFYPWVTRYQNSQYYDPFYANYRGYTQQGYGNNLLSWIGNQHQTFAKLDRIRPARTIAAQQAFLRANQGTNVDPATLRLASIGESLKEATHDNDNGTLFKPIDKAAVNQIRRASAPLKEMGRERAEFEGTAASTKAGIHTSQTASVDRSSNDRKEARQDAPKNDHPSGNENRGRLTLKDSNATDPADIQAEVGAKASDRAEAATKRTDRKSGANSGASSDPNDRSEQDKADSSLRSRADAMRPPRPDNWPQKTSAKDRVPPPNRPNQQTDRSDSSKASVGNRTDRPGPEKNDTQKAPSKTASPAVPPSGSAKPNPATRSNTPEPQSSPPRGKQNPGNSSVPSAPSTGAKEPRPANSAGKGGNNGPDKPPATNPVKAGAAKAASKATGGGK